MKWLRLYTFFFYLKSAKTTVSLLKNFVCMCVQVCVCVWMCRCALVCILQRATCRRWFSFSTMWVLSRVQIQIVRLGGKHPACRGRPRQVPTATLLSLTLLRYCWTVWNTSTSGWTEATPWSTVDGIFLRYLSFEALWRPFNPLFKGHFMLLHLNYFKTNLSLIELFDFQYYFYNMCCHCLYLSHI